MTWITQKGMQESRESCGGLGYSRFSKFNILKGNWDV
jgi:hypothetical protein